MKINISAVKDLAGLVRILSKGLNRLTFKDNFESFEAQDIEITSGTEVSIQNKLTSIPSKYIIVNKKGNGNVSRGDKEWTSKHIYLKNHGSGTVTVSVLFMR